MCIYLRTTYSLTTNCLLTYFKTNNSGVEGGGGGSGGGDDDDHTHRENDYLVWSHDHRQTESASTPPDCYIVSVHELPISSDLQSLYQTFHMTCGPSSVFRPTKRV